MKYDTIPLNQDGTRFTGSYMSQCFWHGVDGKQSAWMGRGNLAYEAWKAGKAYAKAGNNAPKAEQPLYNAK